MAVIGRVASRPARMRVMRVRLRASDILVYAVLVLAGLVFLLPFYWMVISSLRPTAQFFELPIPVFPNPPSLENYQKLSPCSGEGSSTAPSWRPSR